MSLKIVLLGYMGCGKTVIARKLSENLHVKCFDLDEIIERNENLSIKSIFKNKGELYFRKLENKLFTDFLNAEENFILSLGGGTPCYFNNYFLLQKEGLTSIYLKASIETLSERLSLEMEKRPLIAHLNHLEIKDFIAKHLFERSFFYNQASKVIIVDNKNINQIIDEIKATLT